MNVDPGLADPQPRLQHIPTVKASVSEILVSLTRSQNEMRALIDYLQDDIDYLERMKQDFITRLGANP